MPDLTLDQVREVGCHAEWVGSAAGVEAVVTYEPKDQPLFGDRYFVLVSEHRIEVTDYDSPDQVRCWDQWPPLDGWHHATGCDCEFCREVAAP